MDVDAPLGFDALGDPNPPLPSSSSAKPNPPELAAPIGLGASLPPLSPKQGGKDPSIVWQHFIKIAGFDTNNPRSQYKYCKNQYKCHVPSISSKETVEYVHKAWSHDPLTTLKLISNLRSIRGTGKSNKERFYTTALWLHKHHPKTLALNAKTFTEFGYFKDLLKILYHILEGELVRETAKREWNTRKGSKGKGVMRAMHFHERKHTATDKKNNNKDKIAKLPKELRVQKHIAKHNHEREQVRSLRNQQVLDKAKKAFKRYNRDPVYRFLHDKVSDVFTKMLKAEMQALNARKLKEISLAAKWCPTIDSAYDKSLLICESIARRVFP
ncbi:uncharacterized protein LOC115953638 [Quercus lobata]|uniref:uncharacterized protein LOC115950450 n=1 Tax=Quercus lobata TaxID=97700 RepID=UPI001247869A|nr:uncharacterized protein LOC115950450 [Quercus lobata]XP_030927240.1 uncharacterized protein LOC115953638 [Quercus lobata]